MTIPHELWLVALSIAIAIQGSFVGLSLSLELDTATGFRRRLALAGSALTLATGIWSMHFVGMLAASFPSAVDYLVLPTLVSFLICVIVVGAGVYAAHAPGPPRMRIGLGAVAMGLGIGAMHYVGMSAVHLAGPTYQQPPYIAASVAVSVAASALALWTLGRRPNRSRLFVAAVVLGLAISGMHYTAMAGMRLDPLCFDATRFVGADSALSRNTLALLATVISFGVSGAFLLSLVPEGESAETIGPQAPLTRAPLTPVPESGSSAPPMVANSPLAPLHAAPVVIRVEKDGRVREISVEDIYAIRANAHYCFVNDGEQEYFCNQSISALETMLDPERFFRVHRSYIVRLSRVSRLKRAGEAAIVELGEPARFSIPVARAHYRGVRERLGSISGAAFAVPREVRQSG
jgi:NO-binding membrane sensor protein with MHYT domain